MCWRSIACGWCADDICYVLSSDSRQGTALSHSFSPEGSMQPGLTTLNVRGIRVPIDGDGYLVHPDHWTPDVAEVLCEHDGIVLTDRHWIIIRFARDYYRLYGISPMPKLIVKGLNKREGEERYSVKMLYALFPGTAARFICRYAGIPQPAGCT